MGSIKFNRMTRRAMLMFAACVVIDLNHVAHAGPAVPCGGGDCYAAHPSPGCGSPACCQMTCFVDPFCCEQVWDALCAQTALEVCRQPGPSPFCLEDFNGDQDVNVLDLGVLLASWSIPPDAPGCAGVIPCAPDLTGDGLVNTLDLGKLLIAWGPCPEPTGACCLGMLGCRVMDRPSCELAGGHFGLEGSTCEIEPHLLDGLPTMVRLYTAATPTVTAASVTEAAASIFGFGGAVTEDPETFTVSDGIKSLVVHKASGVMDFEDAASLWNPDYPGPPSTMTDVQAIKAATVFLRAHGLMPPHQTINEASLIHVTNKAGGKVPNHWGVHIVFIVPVTDEASMLAPVQVQGGDIYVDVGNNEIIGLYRMWRDLTPGELVPARTIPELMSVADTLRGFEPDCPMAFSMRYMQQPEDDVQTLLAPDVIITSAHGHGDGLAVPATTISPWISITSPAGPGPFEPGQPLPLAAEVIGGTPPYQFTWTDQVSGEGPAIKTDPEGALSHSNPVSVSLFCGTHTLGVRVLDAVGMTAFASLVVLVNAGDAQCAAAVAAAKAMPQAECGNPAPAIGAGSRVVRGTHGWSMSAAILPNDGLALFGVRFRGRLLAESMMLPYYWIETTQMPLQTAELKHPAGASANGNCLSTLQQPGIAIITRKDDFAVRATYCIEKLPAGVNSGTMTMRQSYWFEKATDGCAPLDVSSCARYWPMVSYEYYPPAPGAPGQNNFVKLYTFQRLDFEVPGTDLCAYHKDPDNPTVFAPVVVTPPPREVGRLMANLGVAGTVDNYHQRDSGALVGIPGCSGVVVPPVLVFVALPFPHFVTITVPQPPWPVGNWTCTHVHWRWDVTFAALSTYWGSGGVLVPGTQKVYAYALIKHPNEIDPPGLVAPVFFVAGPGGVGAAEPIGAVPQNLVMWQEVESRKTPDVISQNHWFFR